jgi:hypothetical protein
VTTPTQHGHRAQAHAQVHGRDGRERERRHEGQDRHVDARPRQRAAAKADGHDAGDGADADGVQQELVARIPEGAVPADVAEDSDAGRQGQPLGDRSAARP